MATHKSSLPKAVQDIKRLIDKTSGKSVESGVVERLVDFEYEYISSLFTDARQTSQYLGKKDVDLDDLKLAKEMEEKEMNFGPRPSKQQLLALAAKVNEIALPEIKPSFGLRIPPDRFCMTACNYQTQEVVDSLNSSTNSTSR